MKFGEKQIDDICDGIKRRTAIECLKILHGIGGCDADDEYSRGFDAAIDTAFEEIRNRFGIDTEEALDD